MRIEVIQFLLPHGETRQIHIDDMPDDLAPFLEMIRKNNCRLTAEILTTNEVSFAIEHGEGDYDIVICKNGPGVKESLECLIRRFNEDGLKAWIKEINA